jgi:hypothetical protein
MFRMAIIRIADRDGNGTLSEAEFKEVLGKFGELDANDDGQIDSRELMGLPPGGFGGGEGSMRRPGGFGGPPGERGPDGAPRGGEGRPGAGPREGGRPPQDGERPPREGDRPDRDRPDANDA